MADAPDNDEASDSHFDLLILSDSIFRHVGVPVPKHSVVLNEHASPIVKSLARAESNQTIVKDFSVGSNLKIRKIVVPGARCPRLMSVRR